MTQMGLSNTGTEIIRVDSEILIDMSPTKAEGTFAGFEYTDTTTDLRYMNYNTRTSKLWNAFAEEFKEEIKKAYTKLRNSGVYSFENIYNTIAADTDEKIGEIYFNKDAASKYLSQTNEIDSTYLKMLHGNRSQKYKKFLKERLIFLDTIYEYMQSDVQIDSLNSEIGLRSDAAYGQGEGTTVRCYLGISSYSPQYVTVNVGSGADGVITAYVGPESRYKDPDTGIEHEGTLFSFPIRGINKELRITGASNIKRINRLQSLNLTEAVIEKATKILELDFSYSNRMTGLKVGENTYLRKLNCANSYLLGTATESQTLDLSKCKNLKEVDISYTKFTGITFPIDTTLNVINLTGSSIKNISIDGAEFLTDIKITGCDNINKFELNRCNNINKINVANSTIQNFIVTNCNKVTDVNLSGCKMITGFDVTNSYNIVTLDMTGNTSPIMNDLKLYSMYNLKKLIVSETTAAHTIRLPKYLNETEAFKAANGESALLWDSLEHFDLSYSSVKKVQYGSADVDDEVIDMKQLTNLKYLYFMAATEATEIRDINYTGDLSYLFYKCKKLNKISGSLANNTNTINDMFSYCYELSDINALTLNFKGVESAQAAVEKCFSMNTPMLKKILYACGDSLIDVSTLCHMASEEGYVGILGTDEDTTREIPADLFAKNTKLQNVSYAFNATGYKSIPADLFKPCENSLINTKYTFSRMQNLTDVGSSLLHNKPRLATVSHMFAVCYNLTNYINENPNIFTGSTNIQSTEAMFSCCYELASGDSGFGEMMYPLVNLTNCAHMFFDCYANLKCEIPNGFLSKNTKLTKIDGMFQRCRKIPSLPRSLFRVNIGDTNTFPNLKSAPALFAECNNMTGIVDSTFFLGAENLFDIGYYSSDYYPYSTVVYPGEGFFQNTKITGYYESFLSPLKKLECASSLFYYCPELVDCYYYDDRSNVMTRLNSISEKLFENNNILNDVSWFFSESPKLEGHIPPTLFDPFKPHLVNAQKVFAGCIALSTINLDAKDSNEKNTGICAWLKNANNLKFANGFLRGTRDLKGDIPGDFFEGCINLQNTADCFRDSGITGRIPITLFNSCRDTITDTSAMFYGCTSLNEAFPTGEYSTQIGTIAYMLATSGTEGALQVVEKITDPYKQVAYSDVVSLSPNLATIINANGNYYVTAEKGNIVKTIQPGLLAECLKLENISYMFYNCKNIPGAIPFDLLYTSKNIDKYTKLIDVTGLFRHCEGITLGYLEEETRMTYLCDPVLFEKCPAIMYLDEAFSNMYGIPNTCQVHPRMFENQNKVTSAFALFKGTAVSGSVTNILANSVNSLIDASQMFAHTAITNVSANFLNGGGVNKKLEKIYGIFYNCTSLEGTSPEFWNGAKFTALKGNQDGYWGALYRCTKLSNYQVAESISTNWVQEQPIYL